MAIVKQVDPPYEGDAFVAFVESEPHYLKCRHPWEEMNGGDTYFVSLHRKPLSSRGVGVAHCRHRHRDIDAAARCARKMLKTARRSAPERKA